MDRTNYREISLQKIKQIESHEGLEKEFQKLLLDYYKKIANMSYSEYVETEKQEEREHEAYLAKLRKEFIITEQQADLIFSRFDAWLEKYKNDIEHLEEEYETGHCFLEPWFWGKHAPHAESEFYEELFDGPTYWEVGKDNPVFYSCRLRIKERIKELKTA